MKEYQVAVIYTVKAETYEEALALTESSIVRNEGAQVVYDYETDNDGQRVVYLTASWKIM